MRLNQQFQSQYHSSKDWTELSVHSNHSVCILTGYSQVNTTQQRCVTIRLSTGNMHLQFSWLKMGSGSRMWIIQVEMGVLGLWPTDLNVAFCVADGGVMIFQKECVFLCPPLWIMITSSWRQDYGLCFWHHASLLSHVEWDGPASHITAELIYGKTSLYNILNKNSLC